jgi:hypothetical protein
MLFKISKVGLIISKFPLASEIKPLVQISCLYVKKQGSMSNDINNIKRRQDKIKIQFGIRNYSMAQIPGKKVGHAISKISKEGHRY